MALGFTGEMEDLVRPEKKHLWNKKRKKIFVINEKDAKDLRKPGKFKQEFTTTNGGIIMFV